ncbi:hypothetical protein [Mesorhizobium sp. SP-1A]|uniref:hypothetical protein n=1 Tax=Mesorhizobium sp. SP-1A TaxID=3077840 RepID=UPI0028F72346|nr:hypothetical protein [Mesorhizobium sp. SP-1A]
MSNTISIERTVFQTMEKDGSISGETYGIRIFDDNAVTYNNNVPTRDALKEMSADELIQLARETDDIATDMLWSARENGQPVYVDGEAVELEPSSTNSL